MSWILRGLLALAAGCAAAAPEPAVGWPAVTVGQAEQSAAPALWADAEGVMLAWVGADETGIHQDARTIIPGGLTAAVVLPLPPTRPYGQQLSAAAGSDRHLLWLDADAEGQNRLYAAVITGALAVKRGPTPVSAQITRRYAILPNGDGTLWVVSGGGLAAEPGLYAHFLDPAGRPRQENPAPIVTNADWPSFIQWGDGAAELFWRQPSDGTVKHAPFAVETGTLGSPAPLTTLNLAAGDRLDNLSAARDHTHGYLFANITHADGERETRFAGGEAGAADWGEMRRLGIAVTTDHTFAVSFNAGAVMAAGTGARWLSLAAPAAGDFESLPVAVMAGDDLGIVYFQGGQPAGFQIIAPDANLIGTPALQADRERFLYLAWAQPTAAGTAALRLASLRLAGWLPG
ncbi:MAG: hypothetical protein HXY41_06505 [Chloroflexi bacterium]|nr:hypothetical protein [Chloroflexota bacterium]